MEDVLDVYTAPPDPEEPLVTMNEASKQLLGGVHEPIPASPGRTAKEDYHYVRHGVRAIFMFFDPVRGWRRVTSRPQRQLAQCGRN